MLIHEKDKKSKLIKKENDILINKNSFNKTYSILSSNDTSKNITPVVTPIISVKPSSVEVNSLNLGQSQILKNNFKNSFYSEENLDVDYEKEYEKIFKNVNLNYGKTIFTLYDNTHLNEGVENKKYLSGINNEKNNSDDLDDLNSIEFISPIINGENNNNNNKYELFLDY